MNTLQEVFGEPIYTYSRSQAIEDGVLVDLMQDEMAPVCRQHYKYPIACTAAVFGIIERAVKAKSSNSFAGIVHDILWMSRTLRKQVDPQTVRFAVRIVGGSRQQLYQFKMVCGPGDNAEPVLTLMLPDEDDQA